VIDWYQTTTRTWLGTAGVFLYLGFIHGWRCTSTAAILWSQLVTVSIAFFVVLAVDAPLRYAEG
jgi:hypothetical protein